MNNDPSILLKHPCSCVVELSDHCLDSISELLTNILAEIARDQSPKMGSMGLLGMRPSHYYSRDLGLPCHGLCTLCADGSKSMLF